MSKHTPSPWLIDTSDPRFVYAINRDGYNQFHAHVQGVHTSTAELEANARLIASAPDLLAALESCRDWLVSTGADGAPLPMTIAAIAKATGAPP